jgi:hypothetical protein
LWTIAQFNARGAWRQSEEAGLAPASALGLFILVAVESGHYRQAQVGRTAPRYDYLFIEAVTEKL